MKYINTHFYYLLFVLFVFCKISNNIQWNWSIIFIPVFIDISLNILKEVIGTYTIYYSPKRKKGS